jgi:hypothetical protein
MESYLREEILTPIRQDNRRKLCLSDEGIFRYLLSVTFNKVRCPSLVKNVRAYAHLLCRYFLPLFVKHGWTTTGEALKMRNREPLYSALMELGGITAFYEDSDAYIKDLENEAVR